MHRHTDAYPQKCTHMPYLVIHTGVDIDVSTHTQTHKHTQMNTYAGMFTVNAWISNASLIQCCLFSVNYANNMPIIFIQQHQGRVEQRQSWIGIAVQLSMHCIINAFLYLFLFQPAININDGLISHHASYCSSPGRPQ